MQSQRKRILITGASSGIGEAMARELAARGFDLVLTARRLNVLTDLSNELESRHGVKVNVVGADLARPEEAIRLYDQLKASELDIDVLVNNAGFGGYGNFVETDLASELDMIQVNVSSLVVLTKLFLKDMTRKGQGRIMNIASLLSYLPFPYYSVYSATKTFVLSFSQTLRSELEGSGVEILTLAPGPVDTAFNSDAMLRTNAYKANRPMPVYRVAQIAADHLLAGKGTRIVGSNNRFIAGLPRITPAGLMMRIKKNLASQASA